MSKIDAFEFDQRDRRAFKEFIREYDLEDPDDCEHYSFVAMTLAMLVADRWNPYHVIGVLQCTINHIYKMLEEDDE